MPAGYAKLRNEFSLSETIDPPKSDRMKIAIGSDHAGFRYKEKIKEMLRSAGHEVIDFGTDSEEPCDYPLFIRPVAEAVAHNEVEPSTQRRECPFFRSKNHLRRRGVAYC